MDKLKYLFYDEYVDYHNDDDDDDDDNNDDVKSRWLLKLHRQESRNIHSVSKIYFQWWAAIQPMDDSAMGSHGNGTGSHQLSGGGGLAGGPTRLLPPQVVVRYCLS